MNKKIPTDSHYDIPFSEYCISVKKGTHNKNTIQLINSQTNSAKTWWTFNCGIPTLFNEYGVRLICYTYPYSEIYEDASCRAAVCNSNNVIHLHIEKTTSKKLLVSIKDYIESGKNVLISSTFNSFFAHKEEYGDRILDLCKELNIQPALFLDEVHQWSTSDIQQYRYNTGNSNSTFNASLYSCVSKWSEWSPYVFGLTATLTPEQQTNRVEGKTQYEVLVNPLPIQKLMYKAGWLDSFTYFDKGTELHTFSKFIDEFEDSNRSLLDWSSYAYQKNNIYETSMLIRVENINGDFNKDVVLNELIYNLRSKFKGGYLKMEEYSTATMTQHGCYIYNLKGNSVKSDVEEIKEMLNDKRNPLRYLIVIERGKSGMNINTLKWYFDFRFTYKENEDGWIITNLLQLCGRLQRLNIFGWDIGDFIKKYGYSLEDYIYELISNGEDSLLNKLFKTNSYRVCVPNLPNWKEVESNIKNEVSNTLSTVKELLSKSEIEKIIQQSIVQCKINIANDKKYLENISADDFSWSEMYNLDDTITGLSKTIGVYQFIYKPTNEIIYIGRSNNIANRRSKHLESFKSGCASENEKSYFKSIVGVKMAEFDSNIGNYGFKYMVVGNEILAKEIESSMINHYSPVFNSKSMGGK